MEYSQHNPSDAPRPAATDSNLARHVATDDDYISIKEAQALFLDRGREITERSLQRSCAKNHLIGHKSLTLEGEKWFVLKSSVLHRLAELEEFDRVRASRQDAVRRLLSPSVAEEETTSFSHDEARPATEPDMSPPAVAEQSSHTTDPDASRHAAVRHDMSRQHDETVERTVLTVMSERERELYEKLVTNYEDQIEDLMKDKTLLQEDKKMLVEQLMAKDKQIEHFFNSERDTKTLAARLQSLVSAIWPSAQKSAGDRFVPMHDALESGLDDHREGSGR